MTFYAAATPFGKMFKPVKLKHVRTDEVGAVRPAERDHTAVAQPSLQQFAVYEGSDVYGVVGLPYDARSNLDRWSGQGKGWGSIGMRHPHGPTEGNPWGFNQSDLE
jgi:hypothetical protein